jgi:hypothetical protein
MENRIAMILRIDMRFGLGKIWRTIIVVGSGLENLCGTTGTDLADGCPDEYAPIQVICCYMVDG